MYVGQSSGKLSGCQEQTLLKKGNLNMLVKQSIQFLWLECTLHTLLVAMSDKPQTSFAVIQSNLLCAKYAWNLNTLRKSPLSSHKSFLNTLGFFSLPHYIKFFTGQVYVHMWFRMCFIFHHTYLMYMYMVKTKRPYSCSIFCFKVTSFCNW